MNPALQLVVKVIVVSLAAPHSVPRWGKVHAAKQSQSDRSKSQQDMVADPLFVGPPCQASLLRCFALQCGTFAHASNEPIRHNRLQPPRVLVTFCQ